MQACQHILEDNIEVFFWNVEKCILSNYIVIKFNGLFYFSRKPIIKQFEHYRNSLARQCKKKLKDIVEKNMS